MEKKDILKYRDCDISYFIFSDNNNKFSADACISVHFGDGVVDQKIITKKKYSKLAEAEEAIINACKKWIDDKLEMEK